LLGAVSAEDRIGVIELNIAATLFKNDLKRNSGRSIRSAKETSDVPPFHDELPVGGIPSHFPEHVLVRAFDRVQVHPKWRHQSVRPLNVGGKAVRNQRPVVVIRKGVRETNGAVAADK
jgi:hypothetical protein